MCMCSKSCILPTQNETLAPRDAANTSSQQLLIKYDGRGKFEDHCSVSSKITAR